MRDDYLFAKVDIYSVLEHQKQQVIKKIQELPANQITGANEEDLVRRLIEEFKINVPVIQDDKISIIEHSETKVDVSRDFNRMFYDRSQPHYVQGIKVTIGVPFEGDAEMFKVQPNSYTTTRP